MRIDSLTFLRFVAALIVVVFHFGGKATGWTGFLVSGPQMVTFFFVLSGFVMAFAYGGKPKVHFIPYLWARLARLVPMYWIALGIVVALQIVRDVWFGLTPRNLFLNFTLLQAWPKGINPLNYPSWSLSVELFFYLTFPLSIAWCRKLMKWPRALATGTLVVWAAIHWGLSTWLMASDSHSVRMLIDFSPLSHIPSFVMGVIGGLFFIDKKWLGASGFWSLVGTVVSATLIVVSLNNPDAIESALGRPLAFRSSLHSPLFLMLILCLASSRWAWSEVLAWRPLVFLGEASYSFYILQLPVFQLHVLYLRPHLSLGHLGDFLIFLTALLVSSIATYLWIEKPLNRYLRSKKPFFIFSKG